MEKIFEVIDAGGMLSLTYTLIIILLLIAVVLMKVRKESEKIDHHKEMAFQKELNRQLTQDLEDISEINDQKRKEIELLNYKLKNQTK